MREILFCGKRKDNGEWVYGYYFCLHHNDGRKHLHHFIIPIDIKIPKDKPIGEIQVEVIPETVGQFIGLPDENGKWIFDGDIVKSRNNGDRRGVIEWNNKMAGYKIGLWDFEIIYNNCCLEVIGNIHDNPELLGGTE